MPNHCIDYSCSKQVKCEVRSKGIPHPLGPFNPFYEDDLEAEEWEKLYENLIQKWTRTTKNPIPHVVFKTQHFVVMPLNERKKKDETIEKLNNDLKKLAKLHLKGKINDEEYQMKIEDVEFLKRTACVSVLALSFFVKRLTYDIMKGLQDREFAVECLYPLMIRKGLI
jgi:hypothetical protein